jgi:hypothetical protein
VAKELISLEFLSSRGGFNAAVRHIKKTLAIVETLGTNNNLGDLLFESEDEELSGERIALLLRMILVDKLGYKASSANLRSVAGDLPALADELGKWKAVDLVAAYHHPDLGLLTANPKVPRELAAFGALKKRELLVIYAGKAGLPADDLCQKAAELALLLFEGKKPKIPPGLTRGKNPSPETPAPSAAPEFAARPSPQGLSRITPLYSVAVQNEFFHNGNLEAWKRIIESYKTKYPDLQIHIYYEGERILDINALFKWGKVRHGSTIQFTVAGNNIRDVAKLQRYLIQGASPRFEAFLRGSVNTILKLF